jgi:hypothetical protein
MRRLAWADRFVAATLGVAVLTFAWSVVDAVRLAPDVSLPAAGAPVRDMVARDSVPVPDIGVAVARNVFSPARRAPSVAYRLSAGNLDNNASNLMVEVSDRVDPVVLGTALGANGASFAMCSYNDAPAVVVRVGDTIGPYTVLAIARGRVTFRDVDGTRVEVESPTSPEGDLP